MMNINQILEETAETLRGLDFMDGIPVIVEEKADPDNETETAIAQQSLCVVVGEGGFEPTVQSLDGENPNHVIGQATITVSVFEKPVVNRADEGATTIKQLSREIGKALAWCQAEDMAAPLFLRRITPISLFRVEGNDDAIITRDVEFTTTAEL